MAPCRLLDGLDRELEQASGTVEVLNKKVKELIKRSGMWICLTLAWVIAVLVDSTR